MLQRLASLLRIQPPVIANRGLLFASGATVPTPGTDGYQTGCLFLHTDGGAGTALYVNEGSVTSCTFQALAGGIDAGSLAALSDIGTAPSYTAGKILVADGTDYEEVAVSGDATLASGGALTIANSAITAAKLATETATHTIALTDLRKSAAGKDALPDAADGTDLGLADAIGSAVKGTTTNNNAATEKCGFDFVVPQNVGDGDLVLRIKFLFSAARASESLLDVVCKHIKSGELDATDLCLTDPIDVKAVVAETNEDFTIDHDAAGDEIAAGSVLHFEISAESDDGGGGTAGYAQINGIQVRIPCRV